MGSPPAPGAPGPPGVPGGGCVGGSPAGRVAQGFGGDAGRAPAPDGVRGPRVARRVVGGERRLRDHWKQKNTAGLALEVEQLSCD